MEKTYSQKVARVFEIMDYILLLPALLGVLLATLVFSGFTVIVYLVFLLGIFLLVGYRRHSRGNLSPENLPALWIGSAVYNFILLLPCLFWASMLLQEGIFNEADAGESLTAFLFVLSIVAGYLTAVIMSVKAYSFERRKKYL